LGVVVKATVMVSIRFFGFSGTAEEEAVADEDEEEEVLASTCSVVSVPS